VLMARVGWEVKDKRVPRLIRRYLQAGAEPWTVRREIETELFGVDQEFTFNS